VKLKQLQEKAGNHIMIGLNKKIAALLLGATCVVWIAGFIITGVNAKMGIEILYIFA
jgi:hypothetical protein